MDSNGDMVVPNTQKSLAAMETSDHTHLFFRQVEDILGQAALFLHLHNEFDAAAVQDSLTIFAAVQGHHIGHALRSNASDTACDRINLTMRTV